MAIHDEHPFLPDPDDRDPVRRFRGRLAMPVTIVTSGAPDARAGLTVSSVLVMEGDPGAVLLLVNPNTDLWDAIAATGRLMVHVCGTEHRSLAEVFAGRQPRPGGMFSGLGVTDGEWGPVLETLPNRIGVTVTSTDPAGWSGIVRGRIDHVEVSGMDDPLLYFRGRYRRLG